MNVDVDYLERKREKVGSLEEYYRGKWNQAKEIAEKITDDKGVFRELAIKIFDKISSPAFYLDVEKELGPVVERKILEKFTEVNKNLQLTELIDKCDVKIVGDSVTITAPEDLVGRLIGRDGWIVKQVNDSLDYDVDVKQKEKEKFREERLF